MRNTFSLDWEDWIAGNLFQHNCKFHIFKWSHLFIFTYWFIWKWRNKYIFDEGFHGPYNASGIIFQYITEWNNANMRSDDSNAQQIHLLNWEKPNLGHFKLNVDGSRSSTSLIGAGGVIRDSSGAWIFGFMKNIGSGEVLCAEAWGLIIGLQIAVELGIKDIVIESDSAILINMLSTEDNNSHPLGILIANCKALMHSFDTYVVQHIHRKRNMVADTLAKRSTDQDLGLCRLPFAPSFVNVCMLEDIAGLERPRAFPAHVAV